MRIAAVNVFIVSLCVTCYSQSKMDSLLSTERSIDRPITLHKGQVRVEAGYNLSVITNRFDLSGKRVMLRDEGISYLKHSFLFDIRYGISEVFTVGILSHYRTQNIRNRQVYTITQDEFVELFTVNKRKGFDDLQATISARLPFTSKKLDLIITTGMNLPFGNDIEDQPEHSVTQQDANSKSIVYRYNRKWGSGTTGAIFGGAVKYRLNDYAITLQGFHIYPLDEGENVRWRHQLVNGQFQYESESYRYLNPGISHFQIELEKQLAPWFDLSLLMSGEFQRGGWIGSENITYSLDEANLVVFSPGFEILITPKIWLRQRTFISVSGKNAEAPFAIHTALVYNFFPF